MKYISILFLILFKKLFSQPPEDKITKLPDYPYEKEMYSGYLKVYSIKSYFYLYIKAEEKSDSLPLLLWLNGGPFCSSLGGWSDENGPCYMEGDKFILNPYSWNKLANLLYIESPAGTGFSYVNSTNSSDKKYNDDIVAKENFNALIDFFNKFPSLKNKDFYISGESYAGIYIPMLALEIINYNNKVSDDKKINLKGILIGNGVTDWNYDTTPAMIDFAFTHHLYSYETRMDLLKYCLKEKKKNLCQKILKEDISKNFENINLYDISRDCYIPNSNKNLFYFNYANWAIPFQTLKSTPKRFLEIVKEEKESIVPCIDVHFIEEYLNREEVQKALHIKQKTKWVQCNGKENKKYEIQKKGSIYAYPYILNKIRILIYSGDTDMVVPFNGNQAWIRNLKLPIISDWKPWRAVDLDGNIDMENIAGYRTIYQGLIFTTIKGTGHMVPQWKRKEAFHMVKKFLNNEDF